jgi:hypothetical protein
MRLWDEKDVLNMGEEAFLLKIAEGNPMAFSGYYEVNLGKRKRGQGKRYCGMVLGSMSCSKHGVQKYHSPLRNLPGKEKYLEDIKILNGNQQARYAQARDAGFNHIVSMHHAIAEDKAFDILNKKYGRRNKIK